MVTVSHAGKVQGYGLIIFTVSRSDEIPPVGMCIMTMHEQQPWFTGTTPVTVLDIRIVNLHRTGL